MKSPALIMAGAKRRLLPVSLPYRFFMAAGVYHTLAWALMLAGADQVPGYQGGAGLVLATLHALTLGVLVMVVIGPSLQIIPVVTNVSLGALWPARLVSWLFIPGTAILIYGFAFVEPLAMTTGGLLVTWGLATYVFILIRLLSQASGFKIFLATSARPLWRLPPLC